MQQRTRIHTKITQVSLSGWFEMCWRQVELSLVSELERADSSTATTQPNMMETSSQEQQVQQINVVDDAALQEVLSSMTEPEMNAFLDELNKTGKACKWAVQSDWRVSLAKVFVLFHRIRWFSWKIVDILPTLDLPGIGQTIELLTVPAPSEATTSASTLNSLPTSQATQSQLSADSVLQELKTLIQQAPADIVPMAMEQKLVHQPVNQKSNMHMSTSTARQSRTANTYGGTSVAGSGSRPGTAVKSTVTASGGATIRKPFPQQSINDDRMFFGRPTSSMPTTIGQGQYHNRTGLMPTHRQQQQQPVATVSSLGQQQQQQQQQQQLRRTNPSTGFDHHQQSSQRRTLSWFQWVSSNEHSSTFWCAFDLL